MICDNMRQKHGHQIRSSRKVPGMSGIPGVQKYQAVSGEDRRRRARSAARIVVIQQDQEGQKILRLRGQSGMRLHVLAETLRKTVSEMRFYACRKRK